MHLKNVFLASTALCIPFVATSPALAADTVYDSGSSVVNGADTATGNYIIGDTGTAMLFVADTGSLTTSVDIIVGSQAGSDGTLLVNGGALTANRYYIGLGGAGSVTLTDGASLTATGVDEKVYVGYFGNSTGTLNLSDAGTTLTAYDLNIAWTGNGSATISNGATATLEQDVTLGKNGYTTGTLTITGAGSSVTSNRLFVGQNGTGTLNILGGGSYTVVATAAGYSKAHVGWTAGSAGTINISGTGSTLTADFLVNGWNGNGTMTIADGGAATIATDVYIANGSPSTSALTVTGDGSRLTSDRLYVGLSGDGSLYVLDGGSVSTTGTNKTYLGNVSGGTGYAEIRGEGSSLSTGELNIGWNGDGTMLVTDDASVSAVGTVSVGYATGSTGTLTLADGGTMTVGNGSGILQIGQLSGSTGTVNIGAAAGEPAVAAGTLDAGTVSFGAGGGNLVFNHTDTAYVFDAALSGTGDIDFHSGTTTLSADSSGFDGTGTIHGGTVMVTGTLGGSLAVNDDGTLGGTGTVGTTTVASGGTITPGLSGMIGTLRVDGDLTLSAGSTYAVNLSGGLSDVIIATGTATINGATLSVSSLDAGTSYTVGQTYTILAAGGGRTGTFADPVTGSLVDSLASSAFLELTTAYDANNAYLTVAARSSGSGVFDSVARTSNQHAVAGALDTLAQSGDSLSLYNTLLMMTADEARDAYDQMSGSSYAGQQAAMIQGSTAINTALNNRMRSAFETVGTAGTTRAQALGYAEEKKADENGPFAAYETKKTARLADPDRFAVWGSGFGSRMSGDGLDGTSGTDSSTGGFLIGADGMVSERWRVGLSAGHSDSSFNTDESTGDSNNYHIGAYAGTEIGKLSFRSGLSYTWYDVDSSRSVAALGETLEGAYDATSFNAFGELGYRMDLGETALEPFAALAYSHLKTNSFTETGGLSALTVDGSTMDTAYSTLGMRASHDFDLGGVIAVARGMVGWRYAFGDVTPTSTARFMTGDAFTVSSTPLDRNAALVEAGLDLKLDDNATVGIGYSGQFGKSASENGFNAQFRVTF